MDALTTLLATITRSLSVLQKKKSSTKPEATLPSATADAATEATPTEGSGVAPVASTTPATVGEASITGTADEKEKPKETKDQLTGPDSLIESPPHISPATLRLTVNALDAGECSSRTFSQTLGLLQNLSHLDTARDTILDELKLRAEKISEQLIPDLVDLLSAINSEEPVRGTTLSKFTSASSSQAKLLRILKTIDFFGTAAKKAAPVPPTSGEPASKSLSTEEEQVKTIYSSLTFSELWKRLGDALAGIEAKPDLLYLSTVLLPLIESLLVVNKFTDSSSTEFIDFTTAHSKILNTMVRNNPSLMSGSFAVLVRNSSMLDFENKRSYFFSVRPCPVILVSSSRR
jgi:E3 ubiquitin-protein ligase HUWE1